MTQKLVRGRPAQPVRIETSHPGRKHLFPFLKPPKLRSLLVNLEKKKPSPSILSSTILGLSTGRQPSNVLGLLKGPVSVRYPMTELREGQETQLGLPCHRLCGCLQLKESLTHPDTVSHPSHTLTPAHNHLMSQLRRQSPWAGLSLSQHEDETQF